MFYFRYLAILLFFFNISAFKINRVILSWDNNVLFEHFWPIVSKAWNKNIGIRPTLFFIGSKKIKVDTTYGDVIYVSPIIGVPTAYQAMAIRVLAPALYPNDFCIISDLDMIPINKEFFNNVTINIPESDFVVFYPYFYSKHKLSKDPERYMMCYNAAKGSTFANIFNVRTIKDMQTTLYAWYKDYYSIYKVATDEKMLFKYLQEWEIKDQSLHLMELPMSRLSREHWESKIINLKTTNFYDSHLPRPYNKFKKEIDELLKYLNL